MKSEALEKPVVSVRLMTYNHALYIAEAIEGCLAQKTNFPFEIVVGDDFSSDGTREICERYANEYPDKIILLDRSIGGEYWLKRQELGRLYNFTDILDHCRGKYIALLDGDDYWIDEKKLQKQVDILDTCKEYALCCHGTKIKSKNSLDTKDFSFLDTNTISQNDLLSKTVNNFVPTASLLFRKQFLPKPFPSWFYNQPMGDWALNLYLLQEDRKGYFLTESMSVYRREGQGVWDQLSNIPITFKKRDFVQNLKHIDLDLNKSYLNELIRKYDELLDGYINELHSRDYRIMTTPELLNHLVYRVKYSIKKRLGIIEKD